MANYCRAGIKSLRGTRTMYISNKHFMHRRFKLKNLTLQIYTKKAESGGGEEGGRDTVFFCLRDISETFTRFFDFAELRSELPNQTEA
jgi:hypothetical protein